MTRSHSHILIWTLLMPTVLLVILLLFGMLAMMTMGGTTGGGMSDMMNGMMSMSGAGRVWMLIALLGVIALVIALVRTTTKL